MNSNTNADDLILREIRRSDRTFARRTLFDRAMVYLRSCAVCTTTLPPIDLLCPVCWREFGGVMNRGGNLRQTDFVFPTYSLLTWTPATARFVKPFIYGFKGGYNVRAADKLATLFLSERGLDKSRGVDNFAMSVDSKCRDLLVSAPSAKFDHSQLWAKTLSRARELTSLSPFQELNPPDQRQKELRQGERGQRRYGLREHFANLADQAKSARRIVFADDVITSGSTAMAAYMALGDPDRFEVWTLVARPRLAGR